jgi:rod shape-determining protein MreD
VVLLAVVALARANGPMTGVLIGFWGGLALDVAPPGSHFVGQNALVFCLIGYACGLAADVPNSEGVPEQGHTALFEIVVTAVGAVLGEALASLLGAMLSDPRVSWSAIQHVLPAAAVYDVLLCPFVLYAAAAVLRLAGTPRGERSRAAWSMPARASAATAQGAIRQVNGGNTPRLRLSERGQGEGLGGGLGGGLRGSAPAKREPRLKLGQGGALGAGALSAAFTPGSRRGQGLASGTMAGALGGAAKVKFGARRGEGGLGGTSRSLNLSGSGLNTSRFGRSLLGGSVFSHSPSALRPPAPARRSPSIGRSSFLGRSPALFRSAPGGSATGYGPRLARPGLLTRLAGALHRTSVGRKSLGRTSLGGTSRRQPLRGSSSLRGSSPGRGWLRRSPHRRGMTGGRPLRLGAGPARLHMPRPRAKKRWPTGGYR